MGHRKRSLFDKLIDDAHEYILTTNTLGVWSCGDALLQRIIETVSSSDASVVLQLVCAMTQMTDTEDDQLGIVFGQSTESE